MTEEAELIKKFVHTMTPEGAKDLLQAIIDGEETKAEIIKGHTGNMSFNINDDPILTLTPKGFKYKGQYIDDPKDACNRLHEWLDSAEVQDNRTIIKND